MKNLKKLKKIICFLTIFVLFHSQVLHSEEISLESDVYSSYEGQSQFGGAKEGSSTVNPKSGDLMRQEIDLKLDGPIPVQITRWYNSGVDFEKVGDYSTTHDMGNWDNHQGEIVYTTYVPVICSEDCYNLEGYTQDTENPTGVAPPSLEWNLPDGSVRKFYYETATNPYHPYETITGSDGSYVIIPLEGPFRYKTMEGDILELSFEAENKISMKVITNMGDILLFLYQTGVAGWSVQKPNLHPAFWDIDLTYIDSRHYYPIYKVAELVERKDLYGNKIEISHSTAPNGSWEEGDGNGLVIINNVQKSRIDTIKDSYGRILKFEYYDNKNKRLKKIYLENSDTNFQVEYFYQKTNTDKLVSNGYTEPSSEGGGYYILTEVKKQGLYNHWKYTYWMGNNGGEKTNYFGTVLLKKAEELTYGLNESYYYTFSSVQGGKKPDGTFCYNQKQMVQKVLSDSYQDIVNETSYNYDSSGITTVRYGDDSIKDIYYYYTQENQFNWRAGLLAKKVHVEFDFEEETTYGYVNNNTITTGISLYGLKPDTRYGTTCSYDDRGFTRDTGIIQIGIVEQRVKSKMGDSSGFTHETVYSNFDYSSNNWQTKTETGPDGVGKITSREYWFNPSKNIVGGKIYKEKFCIITNNESCSESDGSLIERKYLETGLLDKEFLNSIATKDVDYVDSTSRIHKIYDANGNFQEFGDYTFGEIAKVEYLGGFKVIQDRSVSYSGMLKNETNILNQTVSLDYDENNVLESIHKPLTNDIEVIYESRKFKNSLISTMYKESRSGNQVKFSYLDGLGRILYEYNELGIGKLYFYNSLGKIAKIQELVDSGVAINGSGQYSPVFSSVLSETFFDEMGRKNRIVEDGVNILSITYDDKNNKIIQTDAEGIQVTLEFEGFGHVTNKRLKKRIDGICYAESSSEILKENNVFSLTNLFHNAKTYFIGLLSSREIDADLQNGTTELEYFYTKDGQIRQVQVNGKIIRTHEFDPTTKRIKKIIRPESDPIEFTFDSVGNLKIRKDGGGIFQYEYNSRNLLERVYDGYNGKQYYHYTYDDLGRRISVTDLQNKIYKTYVYDQANRVTQEWLREYTKSEKGSGKIFKKFAYVIQYVYDAEGLLNKVIYPDTSYVSYHYNNLNQLIKMEQYDYSSDTSSNVLVNSIAYTSIGGMKKINYGDELFPDVIYNYDDSWRVNNVISRRLDGSDFINQTYDYYLNHKIRKITDTKNNTNSVEYGYDSFGRLGLAKGPWGELSYSYDDLGNKLEEKINDPNGLITRDRKYYYQNEEEDRNRLTDFEDFVTGEKVYFDYDSAGNNRLYEKEKDDNLVSKHERYFDQFGRVQEFVNHQQKFETTSYTYDENNHRIKKVSPEQKTTWYIRDLFGNVIAEMDENRVILRRHYFVGTKRLMTEEIESGNKKVYYYNVHNDVIGSVTRVVGESNPKEELFISEPFGEIFRTNETVTSDFEFGMEGKEQDDESGLFYFGARYYDSKIGRFISLDPIDGKLNDSSQNYNGYSYALNDPINVTDFTGMAESYSTFYGTYSEDELGSNIDNFQGEGSGAAKLSALKNEINRLYLRDENSFFGNSPVDDPNSDFHEALNILAFQALLREQIGRPFKVYSVEELAEEVYHSESKQLESFVTPGGPGGAIVKGEIQYLMSGGKITFKLTGYYNAYNFVQRYYAHSMEIIDDGMKILAKASSIAKNSDQHIIIVEEMRRLKQMKTDFQKDMVEEMSKISDYYFE